MRFRPEKLVNDLQSFGKSVIALLKDPTADSPRQNDRILHVLYVFLVAQPLYNPNTSFTLSYTSFYSTLTFEMR